MQRHICKKTAVFRLVSDCRKNNYSFLGNIFRENSRRGFSLFFCAFLTKKTFRHLRPLFFRRKAGQKNLIFHVFLWVCTVRFMPCKRTWFRGIYISPLYLSCPRVLQRRFAARGLFMGLHPKPRTGVFMGLCPKPRTLFWKKRGKNNVLPQSIPLISFVRYFAAFFFFYLDFSFSLTAWICWNQMGVGLP